MSIVPDYSIFFILSPVLAPGLVVISGSIPVLDGVLFRARGHTDMPLADSSSGINRGFDIGSLTALGFLGIRAGKKGKEADENEKKLFD